MVENCIEEGYSFGDLRKCFFVLKIVCHAQAAVKWILSHQTDLGICPGIIVGGESAGGNLAICTALLAKERGLKGISGLFITSAQRSDQTQPLNGKVSLVL